MNRVNLKYLSYCDNPECDTPCVVVGLDEDDMQSIPSCGLMGESWSHIRLDPQEDGLLSGMIHSIICADSRRDME